MSSDAPLEDDPDGDARTAAATDPATADGADAVDGDAVADRIRRRSETIADREVERALRTLEARGDLTDAQRHAVHAMADGIVESLIAAPARTVEAAEAVDDETLRSVVELYDPDP